MKASLLSYSIKSFTESTVIRYAGENTMHIQHDILKHVYNIQLHVRSVGKSLPMYGLTEAQLDELLLADDVKFCISYNK